MGQASEPAIRTTFYIRDWSARTHAIHARIDTPTGKRFIWRQEDGTPGLAGRPPRSLPLYRTEHLRDHGLDEPVYLTEGEKAADALAGVGLVALGTVTGASLIPDDEVLGVLAGREVRLWADNDQIGRGHMARIFDQLVELGASPSIVDWADAPEHGDAADYLEAGHSSDDVLALPIRSAPSEMEGWAESIPGTTLGSPIDTAHGSTSIEAERKLPFRTAREFAESTPLTVDWIVKPWVAAGSITGIDGKIKASGKTTFATRMARAVVDGRPSLANRLVEPASSS